MDKSKRYILTNEDDILNRFRNFFEEHIAYEDSSKWDEINSTSNTHIITGVVNFSNGDSFHYDFTTITLGDVEVSVWMLTFKVGDNIEVYLAPYGCGDQDVISD